MLTLIFGNDSIKRNRARDAATRACAPGQIVSRTDIDAPIEELDMLASASSLFNEKMAVVYSGALDNTDFREYALANLSALAESANQFVFVERECLKEVQKLFQSAGAEIVECSSTAVKKAYAPTIFNLADAFAERDRKKAWALYQIEIENETSPEEILGVLWWSVKSMLLLKVEPRISEKESGMKPYTYNKTLSQVKNHTFEELRSMGRALVRLSHDGHSGEIDLRVGLELFLLGEK